MIIDCIVEVPLEMPMYLLAEDEGNEEEILRLLELESPGGSPSPKNTPCESSKFCCIELRISYHD